MSDQKRLMLIDGHALVHRAFHALPEDMSSASGEPTNAVLGFVNTLLKEIDTVNPTHVIVAMDRPSPTFRHEQFAEYKATRPRTPPTLVTQFGRVRQIIEALRIPIYEVDGFEADDVLGTLACQASQVGVETVILTGDLDALQLVSESIHVRTPGRNFQNTTTYDPPAVRERYGLEPSQLPDWKALVGDTSDNIPGVRGIGAKSATQLIGQFGSLANVFTHLAEVPPKWQGPLRSTEEQALQSRHLSAIVCDAPVTLDLDGSKRTAPDRARLVELFTELSFERLLDRLHAGGLGPAEAEIVAHPLAPASGQLSFFHEDQNGVAEASGPTQTSAAATALELMRDAPGMSSGTDTEVVDDPDKLQKLVERLSTAPRFAFDTETTSTDPLTARLVGLSFAVEPGSAWYVPVGHAEGTQLSIETVLGSLRPVLENVSIGKVGHNLKYDINALSLHDVLTEGIAFDTMIAAYLVNQEARGLSLSSLAQSRLGVEMTPIDRLIGKGKDQITMDLVPIPTVATYAGADADVSLVLADRLASELEEREVGNLFHEIEMPLVTVLAAMEREGVALDPSVLTEMSREMTEIIGRLEAQIYQVAGRAFNISSTQQLSQLLFNQLKLPPGRRTKTGNSTDNEVLENLRGKHEVVEAILEFRQLIKLKNTYVDALPSLINPRTGRVHTDFNQTVASTGRLSSSNPNLQNIPIRGELGRKIRRAFVPRSKDNVLVAADYSQIELRILAAMSGDERLVSAFQSGEDIHRATASAVFGVELEAVTSDQRRIAKVVNFGIIYGIGESRLAYETGITRPEARQFIDTYNQTYSGVKSFMDNMRKRAALYGYVQTLFGRRRYIPDIHAAHPGVRTAAERAAINMPIQGTAADIIKVAMIRLHDLLQREYSDAHMVLQVHDELVFDVPRIVLDPVARIAHDTMVGAAQLSVPLEAEVKVGGDWYDMSPLEIPSSVGAP